MMCRMTPSAWQGSKQNPSSSMPITNSGMMMPQACPSATANTTACPSLLSPLCRGCCRLTPPPA